MPQDIEQAAQNQNGWQVYRRLAGLALQYRWPLGLALLGMLLSGMVSPLMAAYIEPLLDGTFVDKDPKVIAWAPWVLLMIFFIRGLSSYLTGYYMGYVGRSVVSSVRSGLFNKTLTAPLLTLDGQESGVHIGRMLYQAEQLSEAATKGLKILVQDSITVVGLLLWMTYISGQLTLIVLASVPLVALVIRFVTKRFRRISHHLQDSASQVGQVSSEALQGSRDIRVYGGQSHEQTRFELANQNNRTAFLKRLRTDQISTPIVNFILGLALAGVIAYATRLNFRPRHVYEFHDRHAAIGGSD